MSYLRPLGSEVAADWSAATPYERPAGNAAAAQWVTEGFSAGVLPAITITPVEAEAAVDGGGVSADGALTTLEIGAPAGAGTTRVALSLMAGPPTANRIIPPEADALTVSAEAAAGALTEVWLVPTFGEGAVVGLGAGALSSLTLFAPDAVGAFDLLAAGSLAEIWLDAPSGTALVEVPFGEGALPPMGLVSPDAVALTSSLWSPETGEVVFLRMATGTVVTLNRLAVVRTRATAVQLRTELPV